MNNLFSSVKTALRFFCFSQSSAYNTIAPSKRTEFNKKTFNFRGVLSRQIGFSSVTFWNFHAVSFQFMVGTRWWGMPLKTKHHIKYFVKYSRIFFLKKKRVCVVLKQTSWPCSSTDSRCKLGSRGGRRGSAPRRCRCTLPSDGTSLFGPVLEKRLHLRFLPNLHRSQLQLHRCHRPQILPHFLQWNSTPCFCTPCLLCCRIFACPSFSLWRPATLLWIRGPCQQRIVLCFLFHWPCSQWHPLSGQRLCLPRSQGTVRGQKQQILWK